MNIILAVGLLTGLFMYGTEVPEFAEGEAVVGFVEANSPAAAAGIQPGDRIVAIDGKNRPNWEHVEARVMINGGHTIPVTLNRAGQVIEASLTPEKQGPNDAGHSGMRPKNLVTNVIGQVASDSPAERAGLKPGDEIVAVNRTNLKETGLGVSEIIPNAHPRNLPRVDSSRRECNGHTRNSRADRRPPDDRCRLEALRDDDGERELPRGALPIHR
jgi:membrane-associated protease RseP (regulator of RpoE activity)